MKKKLYLGALFISLVALIACENGEFKTKNCKVPIQVTNTQFTFSSGGGRKIIEVNPKPYYIVKKVRISKNGEAGDISFTYVEELVNSLTTENYSVQILEDGKLLIEAFPYYGNNPLKFDFDLKAGDCAKQFSCKIIP